MYPRLTIDLEKLHHNGEMLCAMAARAGLHDLAFVTKCFCAMPEMVRALEDLPNRYLADSRVENLKHCPETKKEKLLLRLPMISEADEVVRWADISLCSERDTLTALDTAAAAQGKTHKVVLMVDMGDLREGVLYSHREELLALARQAEAAEHLVLWGMAFNVTCYGSIIPTAQTLEDFRALVEMVEQALDRKLDFVSAGNSSSLELLETADLTGYNNLRLGESLLLGRETAYGHALPGLYDDAVVLETEIIEARRKPTFPIGQRGMNAFGQVVEYEDRGERLRLLAAVGRQDVDEGDLFPEEDGLHVIGASSDHLILESDAREYRVGDVVRFRLGYGAALRAFTSPYVQKKID